MPNVIPIDKERFTDSQIELFRGNPIQELDDEANAFRALAQKLLAKCEAAPEIVFRKHDLIMKAKAAAEDMAKLLALHRSQVIQTQFEVRE